MMLRLFLATDTSTHILMVPSDTTFDDFKKMCQAKCEIQEARVELDVDGYPAISDINEVRDGDRLKVSSKRQGEAGAEVSSKRPIEDEDEGRPCPSKRTVITVFSDSEEDSEEPQHNTDAGAPLPYGQEIEITYKQKEGNCKEYYCHKCHKTWTFEGASNNAVTRQRDAHMRQEHKGCKLKPLKSGPTPGPRGHYGAAGQYR